MNYSEFQEYIANGMKNILLSIGVNQIVFDKTSASLNNLYITEFAERLEKLSSAIKNNTFSMFLSEELEEYIKVVKKTEDLTEEEFETWFSNEYERSIELGEKGWIPSKHGNPREISEWYQYLYKNPERIVAFFEKENCRVLNEIKAYLGKLYTERPYIRYYLNGIEAFDRAEYMTASLYLTILLENRISNLVEFPERIDGSRLTYKVKYSNRGFENQKHKDYESINDFIAKRFLFLNVYPALIAYLNRLFAFGNLPLDLKKETRQEPDYLDRTWLFHGRCCRDITREDCIQLLNALDVCEFALNNSVNS